MSAPWTVWVVCGAAARSAEVDSGGSPDWASPDPFRWASSYRDAVDAANAARTPILVYFPPVGEPDPPSIARAPSALGSPPRAQGVRVGADDVTDLVERFQVEDVPCLLLLDRTEKVVVRWTRVIPSSAWPVIDSAIRTLERRETEYRRILDRAEEELASGDAESAYRRVRVLLEPDGVPRDVVGEARRVESRLEEHVRDAVLSVLAAERIQDDSRLVDRLEEIRDDTRHRGLREEILVEIRRIQTGTILGKPTDLRSLRPPVPDPSSDPAR